MNISVYTSIDKYTLNMNCIIKGSFAVRNVDLRTFTLLETQRSLSPVVMCLLKSSSPVIMCL